jgi:enoyl-CoA hydratase/carnithine racemase
MSPSDAHPGKSSSSPANTTQAAVPRDAERKGLVHETVSGRAIDCAKEIAKRLSSHAPESLGYIKRLVRSATDTPLAQGLALERNLFMKLCVSRQALARMRSYEERRSPHTVRSIEAKGG